MQKSTKRRGLGAGHKKKAFILDTNVIIHEPIAITNFGDEDVIIPITVIEELDKFKNSQDGNGFNAREAMRILDTLFPNEKVMQEGYQKPQGGSVRISHEIHPVVGLGIDKADNRILGCALSVQSGKKQRKVIVVSKDLNVRVKARSMGLAAEDLKRDKVEQTQVDEFDYPTVIIGDDQLQTFITQGEGKISPPKDLENYCYIKLAVEDQETQILAKHMELGQIRALPNHLIHIKNGQKIKPRNSGQEILLDALLDDEVHIVTVFGKAGTGKTLLTVAAGLDQVQQGAFEKLTITRPVVAMGGDIGFLKGDKKEKMQPWIQPFYDALEFLFKPHKQEKPEQFRHKRMRQHPVKEISQPRLKPQEYLMEQGVLEIEVLAHIRGRSIPNQFFVLDEAQQVSRHEIKTVLTRISEGTKAVILGDPDQIDNPYLDKYSNGLVQAASRLKGQKRHVTVFLDQGERSEAAELAAELL